jgi:hypothetical protein
MPFNKNKFLFMDEGIFLFSSGGVLGNDFIQSCRWLAAFQKNTLFPSSMFEMFCYHRSHYMMPHQGRPQS